MLQQALYLVLQTIATELGVVCLLPEDMTLYQLVQSVALSLQCTQGPVLEQIVKFDRIPNTEYIRILKIHQIPNTEYIRFLKNERIRIPNSAIQT